MNEKEVLDIVALCSGMALGLLASALVAVISRMKRRTLRLLCASCTRLCLLSLPPLAVRLLVAETTFEVDLRRLLALFFMGFIVATIVEIIDWRKKRRRRGKAFTFAGASSRA